MENIFNFFDSRLSQRADYSLSKIQECPDKPLPQVFYNYADLEGFYRLIKNKRLCSSNIMKDISEQTASSLNEYDEVAIIHDTTFVNPNFNKKSKILGHKGIGTHLSLVASASDAPSIFGAINLQFVTRNKEGKKTTKDVESKRWFEGVRETEKKLSGIVNCIHLMDREGDIYSHFCEMNEHGYRYVIRACYNRPVEENYHEDRLFDSIRAKRSLFTLDAKISKREESRFEKAGKIHPKRAARRATLSVSTQETVIVNNRKDKHMSYPEECEVNIVRVWEENPPKKETPIEWILVTSEEIKTKKQIKKIVSLYRRRWLIEEFFKGLKTGCRIEQKQFQDQNSWKKLITIYLPITSKIMNLRVMDRVCLEDLKIGLNESQIKILESLKKKRLETTSDAMYAIASLGGHIKNNGPPGWLTLHRGFKELLTLEKGWRLRCD